MYREPTNLSARPETDSFLERLERGVARARDALLAAQHRDGYWCFELEADCTIPAEYVLMMHFLGEIDRPLQAKIAAFLRARQKAHGGWPLYAGGAFDLSCTVKAYYALKLAGDRPEAPHMARAREAVLEAGGAARANVFTRFALAQFGQIPWRGVPYLPVEIVLLPRWFPFHLSKVAYWSRTVMVPMAILFTRRAQARNPSNTGVPELFVRPAQQERGYFTARSAMNRIFYLLESAARRLERFVPAALRARAMRRAERWIVERLNAEGGLGAIFPAMVNALEALTVLGYPAQHPCCVQARAALRGLLVVREAEAYCQPCVSPVWDTALSCLALHEADSRRATPPLRHALDWLQERQLSDQPGDWRQQRPRLAGGGWPFQFRNDYYPDLDDTSAVIWAMHLADPPRYREAVRRAARWLCGMQSRNGGFGAFDVDNDRGYLNQIPYADHGALLDPPTADVSARCALAFGLLGEREYGPALQRCVRFLLGEQERDGAWFGRWGTNYIYGAWCVLSASEVIADPALQAAARRAAAWLKQRQRPDGGWGESNDSYHDTAKAGAAQCSTSFQTAWAMLGLIAAGEGHSPEVRRGAHYLLRTQRADALWRDELFTAPGFPRVFYLKYHGYSAYFPLWALARCLRALKEAGAALP